MGDVDETKYVDMIISIIDYDFIRRTHKDLANKTNEQIKHLILTGNDDIIVSQIHAQLIVQNDLFNYNFYKSHNPELANMNPTNVLNYYLIYGKDRMDIVSHAHAQELTKNPNFNVDVYKSLHNDLHQMSPIQLVRHYIGFGKQEKRKCN